MSILWCSHHSAEKLMATRGSYIGRGEQLLSTRLQTTILNNVKWQCIIQTSSDILKKQCHCCIVSEMYRINVDVVRRC